MHGSARPWASPTLVLAFLVVSLFLPAAAGAGAAEGRQSQSTQQKKAEAKIARAQKQRRHERVRVQMERTRLKVKKEHLRKQLAAEKKAKEEEEDEATAIWSGFFPWATGDDLADNLPTGLGFAGLGAIGAMILIFGLIGSYLPSMGGKGKYEALLIEIEILESRRDEQIASRERFVRSGADVGADRRHEAGKLTQDLSQAIESKKAEAKQAYRQVLWLGIPIYVVVGGALAVLLATNALQALLIGFAWTSIADRLGLKREQGEKQATKIENVDELTQRAKDGEQAAIELAAEKKVNKEFSRLLRDWEKKGITTKEFKAQSAEVVDPLSKPEEAPQQDPVQAEQIDAAAKMARELT